MERLERLERLNRALLADVPGYGRAAERYARDLTGQQALLRALMNLRDPLPLGEAVLRLQDEELALQREERGVVDAWALPACPGDGRLVLWQGDITRLKADAIVNAANDRLLGCRLPGHACIDNAVHSAAGLQLRRDCREIMDRQGHLEPTGQAKLTPGYNLPARFVLHTVGPIVSGVVTAEDRELLASCYRACLAAAADNGLACVAFCCISTGVFGFPQEPAAGIAVDAVRAFLDERPGTVKRVVFNVFGDRDREIYTQLLYGEGSRRTEESKGGPPG